MFKLVRSLEPGTYRVSDRRTMRSLAEKNSERFPAEERLKVIFYSFLKF